MLAVRNNMEGEMRELYQSIERVLKNSSSLADEALLVIRELATRTKLFKDYQEATLMKLIADLQPKYIIAKPV